jgi:hypothetical protein
MGCEAALFWSSARGARWLRQLHPLHSAGRSEWGARRAAGTVWPGERIGAAGEWGERRAGRGDQAGSEWGAKRAAATDRAGPGEAIEAGSEWGARQRGDATEAGRGDRGWSRGGRDLVSELDGPNVSEVARGCDLQPCAV